MRWMQLAACLILAPVSIAQGDRYLDDFDFIARTVARDGAMLGPKKIDWKAITKTWKPRFRRCDSDRDHVRNVMELLARLRDSHTGVTRSSVAWKELPSKWDGLYGGGLWIGWDRGLVIVRGAMAGHPLERRLPGCVIAAIDGVPAWLAAEREWLRITRWQGSSSKHSLFASLGNRFLRFGDAREIEITYVTPEGKVASAKVARWGPGGKAFSMLDGTLPAGVEKKPLAFSKLIETPWSKSVGYLRITGGMNAKTVRAFHAAFDALRGMDALLLDCRGMGGGGDGSAWAMAGRLYAEGVDNGRNGRIEPTGTWQFQGPVVMLQDELEVSSAETFTWAVSETGRVVSVGRRTGGWGIIPRRYECPSGLVDFRLGVNDRPTPIRGVHTEGVGWPPDIEIPYGAAVCARRDTVMDVGLQALQALHLGLDAESVRGAFRELMLADVKAFRRLTRNIARKRTWKPRDLEKLFVDDIEAMLVIEARLLKDKDLVPDPLGFDERMDGYFQRARRAGLTAPLRALQKARKAAKAEEAAQRQLLAFFRRGGPDAKEKVRFRKRYGKTRTGGWAAAWFD